MISYRYFTYKFYTLIASGDPSIFRNRVPKTLIGTAYSDILH